MRAAAGGVIYHVLNRANARSQIFEKPGDFDGFEGVLTEAHARIPTRVLAYCLMPNHWHLVLWPTQDGELTRFMTWVTLTHSQRWHAHHQSAGSGHLYQGRFKSFPVQADDHLLTVCRYVERNALRAGLVRRAEDWRWSSLWRRTREGSEMPAWLARWPIETPGDWLDWVNQAQSAAELESVRNSVRRGRPFGTGRWVHATARVLHLDTTLRARGRPLKSVEHREKGS